MAKFSDAIQDTLGRVLEGYISAHGGDPTTTPTYQDRQRREELAIEQEKYVPSLDLAFRIARAFGVKLEDVFQYEEEKKWG